MKLPTEVTWEIVKEGAFLGFLMLKIPWLARFEKEDRELEAVSKLSPVLTQEALAWAKLGAWFSVGAGGKISSAKSSTGSSSKPSKTHTTSAPSPLMTWQ